jgi:hypothetical protein
MTLRDALATALHRHDPMSLPLLVGDLYPLADAILADPAFRAALTESIAKALHNANVPEHFGGPSPVDSSCCVDDAAAVIAAIEGETT